MLQIIPFDVARDLKELGFDWSVNSAYFQNNKNKSGYDDLFTTHSEIYENHNDTDYLYRRISAPEQALVVKWLRDVHNIHIQVEPHFKQWFWEICQLNNDTDSMAVYYVLETQRRSNPNAYKTFEQAELEGIKEVIKYLKDDVTNNLG
jgi:hypothetical protein